MKNKVEPLEEIRLIRKMMEESSRFLSLSGLSGISAGICAIAGALIIHFAILSDVTVSLDSSIYSTPNELIPYRWSIILTAIGTLFFALLSAWYFTWKKGRSKNVAFWTPSAKNMIFSLLSVLGVGGALSFILIQKGFLMLVPGLTLTFYGLALLHASKYSHREILYLSWFQIALGLIACIFPRFCLLIWTIGFGMLHIIYGIIMYFKYDRAYNSAL